MTFCGTSIASGRLERAECAAFLRAEHAVCTKESQSLCLRMEFEEYDFIGNPVVQDQVFFLESKCVACELSGLVRSIEELVEHEPLHRTEYRLANALA